MHLAIIIPVYNESRWVRISVDRILKTPPPAGCKRTLILVDDGSSDGTIEIIKDITKSNPDTIQAVFHEINKGKGAALRTGLAAALETDADLFLVHDADLEYDPADHAAVLAPIIDGRADAVIGSRFIGHTHRVLYYWHALANRVITTCCNMATNLNLTDIECCSKAMRRPVLEQIAIQEDRFGVEVELVAKLACARVPADNATAPGATRPLRVYEVAVSYAGRTYAEGKKIGWKDGVQALACIFRYGVMGR
jgi:glycosyltransferase involved in cell wall biosynthesis